MLYLRLCGLIFASLATLVSCGSEGTRPDNFVGGAGGTVVTSGGTTGNTTSGAGTGGTRAIAMGGSGQGGGGSGAVTGNGGVSSTGGRSAIGGNANVGGSGGRSATGGNANVGGSAGSGGNGGTGGSAGTAGSTSTYRPCPRDGTACKIMPFGDSITDGYNSDTPGGYRVELFRLAHSAGKNITFVGSGNNGPATVDGVPFPHNHEGHSGFTIAPAGNRSGISTLVATFMPQYSPHIVLLMIGTNDAIDNYNMISAPTRLGALIDSIYAQLPNVLIVVAQPIPSRGDAAKGDDTALSARIKTFNDAIPAVVKTRADAGKHIVLVDMYTPFNSNKTSLLEDQWHPNVAGYVLIGSQWYSATQSML